MRGVKEFTIRASRADDAVLATFISGSLHAQLAAGLGFAAEAGDDEVAGGHVVGESERVAFEGELARPGANASRLLVGKLDRSTGTLHVVQVGWQCGLELRVKVPGAVVAARDPAAAPLRKRELVDEFGSKKAQKKQVRILQTMKTICKCMAQYQNHFKNIQFRNTQFKSQPPGRPLSKSAILPRAESQTQKCFSMQNNMFQYYIIY
ncbi:hypothetical protein T492DRAFT_474903 [Pavlovales sp. CCMP2436]|nr:hypothetical protein T492DRAFT_474903 [Pavlovales sp. CCMP2436]